jgi:hypothetical protein
MVQLRSIRITNEDEAWDALKDELGSVDDSPIALAFAGWPFIEIHLPQTPEEATIAPSMMEALVELQRTIYRAHTFLAADTGNLRTLSRLEREKFEFRVKVSAGSSDYKIDLTEIAKSLGEDVIGKMNGQDLTITIVAIALIVAGAVAWKAWLRAKTEQRKTESDDIQKREWLQMYQSQLQHDTGRIELLARAIERHPIIGEVEASAESARTEIVKAVGDERGGSVLGVHMSPEIAAEIVTTKRQQSTEVRLAGVYRVGKVDTTASDGFRVTLVDEKTGEELSASLIDAIISAEHRDAIQQAEWRKQPVFVELTARRLRKRLVDAIIVDAKPASAATAGTTALINNPPGRFP